MAVTAVVEHRTAYRFDPPVALDPHVLRLRPAEGTPAVRGASLDVEPARAGLTWRRRRGWWEAALQLDGPTDALVLTARTTVELTAHDPCRPRAAEGDRVPSTAPGRGRGPATGALAELVADLPPPAAIGAPSTPPLGGGAELVEGLVAVAAAVATAVAHRDRHDPLDRSPAEVLARGEGSCRDSAAVLAAALAVGGWPTRVVTGLLVQVAGQPDLVAPWAGTPAGADRSSLHAWVEVGVAGAGWIGLDATSGRPAGAGHLPLAAAPRRAPPPVAGSTAPCRVALAVDHAVRRTDPPGS